MRYWHRLALLFIALVVVNGATYLVLSHNQHAGLYPVNADSIGIPLISTLFFSASAFVFILLAFGIRFIKPVVRFSQMGRPQLFAVLFLLIFLGFPPLALLLLGAGYWAVPYHYLLCIVLLSVLVVLATIILKDIRWLISNQSFKADSLRERP